MLDFLELVLWKSSVNVGQPRVVCEYSAEVDLSVIRVIVNTRLNFAMI